MAEINEVGVVDGVPTSGTGEVPTLAPVRDELIDVNTALGTLNAVDFATEAKQDSAITQLTALNTVIGTTADTASANGTVKQALRAIATATGTSAWDKNAGAVSSNTLRFTQETGQFV